MAKARLRLAGASPAPESLHPAGTEGVGHPANANAGSGHPAFGQDRLALVSELAHVVTWEFELPAPGLRWLTPFEHLLESLPAGAGFRIAPAGAAVGAPGDAAAPGRLVGAADLGEALLSPILEPATAGVVSDSYEVMQELQVPGGDIHQILVRALTTRRAGGVRIIGVIADVSNPGTASWVNTDVGQRLQLLVEHTPDGIIVHQQGIILYANPAALRFAGLEHIEEAVGKPMTLFVHPEHIGPVIERIGQLRDPGDAAKGHEVVIVRPDGVEFTVEVVSVRTTWDGEPAFQVILRDVSERKRAEEAAKARLAVERRYAAAVAALEEGVVVVDHDGVVCAANDSATRILGTRLLGAGDRIFTGGTIARRSDGSVFPTDELPLSKSLVDEISSTDVVIGVSDENGNAQWLSVSSRPIGGVEGSDNAAIVCSVSDITERKQLLDRLAWEARNDPLTGLANRSGFLAAVEEAMGLDRAQRAGLIMMFFDLDRFKLVNDSLGHAVGDEVLLTMAKRLRQHVPRAVSLSRLHGDEFAALEPGIADTEAALARAEELRVVLSRPFRLATGRQLTVTPSIGLVRLADVGGDASEVLQDADMAMLQAKTRGRGRVALFDAGLRDEVSERLELEHDLRVAVETGEQLRLEYQPLASLSNGRVLGFEALCRWDHPKKGPLPPGLFIELAEESDLIISLGKWVLEEGCRQLAAWRAEYPGARDSVISMNVSPRQLDSPDFMPALRGALEQSGLPPEALLLEITESGLVSHDVRIEGILTELRQAGVRLAIDDFGTGYSSLSYLKRLPVSYLKIDRAFVSGLGTDTEDERIVSAVTELAHGLGLRVIAEGIEETGQRDVARALGCDIYQGYLLARPTRPRDIPPYFAPIA